MNDSPRQRMQQLMSSLSTLAADTRELIAQTTGPASERLSQARERARDTLSALETRLSPVQQAIAERSRYAARVSAEHFREHRWSSVLTVAAIALAVAAVVAWQNESASDAEDFDEPQ